MKERKSQGKEGLRKKKQEKALYGNGLGGKGTE
jgi:hypothetical protein